MSRIVSIFTLTLALCPFAAQAFQANDVKSFKLANGMLVLAHEDHSIPNMNMYTFWKVGSRNESPGITGLSHFFEHMMFNGSKNFPPGSFDKVMEASGGSNNAYTTENLTVYTNWFPSSALPTILDLEADRIANLIFDDKVIQSERQVVLSERSTGLENNNWRSLYETLRSVAFTAHPYSWPVIGWESDIKSWSKEDLKNYFETYYSPSNAVVVFSGSFKFDELKRLVESKLGTIQRNTPIPQLRTVEPPQTGERRVNIEKAANPSPLLMMAYHVPATRDPDFYALDLLNEILSNGPSSRLRKLLVDEKRLASSIETQLSAGFDPDLFMIMVQGMSGIKLKDIESTLDRELDALKDKGVTEQELTTAKNKKLVDYFRQQETINGKSEALGQFEMFFGGYNELFQAPERYKAVSRADIQRVIRKYFHRNNRTVGTQAESRAH